jgi:hypothetical protein
VTNCLDLVNSTVWQFLTDDCQNCFIWLLKLFHFFKYWCDFIVWLLFILIWFYVVLKWWWDLVNCMVWMFLLYDGFNQICKLSVYCLIDECWNCFISSSIDVISIWLLFILIWFCVVSKRWWDLVNCMVCIFFLYDGLNQICKLSAYHLMVKQKCRMLGFWIVW